MTPINPGNILCFFEEGYSSNDLRWQRHRNIGTDVVPYGLPCPRTRLVPFQLYFTGSFPGFVAFALINPADDTETVLLDTDLLEIDTSADGYWITWKADAALDVVPDCGYWYILISFIGLGKSVYSEVLDCRDICGTETVDLQIQADSCSEAGSDIVFTLEAAVAAGSSTYTILRGVGISYVAVATDQSYETTETLADETRHFRIVLTTDCGRVITKTYEATWESGDGCNTLVLTLESTSINVVDLTPVWRLNFSNTTDKAQVLYQSGYQQYLYLPLLVWDVPIIDRQIEEATNGEGTTIRRFTRTVERKGFEVPDLPDYVLGWLTKAGDLDTIELEDAKLADSLVPFALSIQNLTFETPGRQGTALNIGRFYYDAEVEAFQGCQENFELLV